MIEFLTHFFLNFDRVLTEFVFVQFYLNFDRVSTYSSSFGCADSVTMNLKRKTITSTKSGSVAASSSMNKKTRSKASQASSPDSVSSMNQRKMTLRLSTRLAAFYPISGVGATLENPILVEEHAVQTSKSARKGNRKEIASSPSVELLSSDVSPGQFNFFPVN